MLRSLWTRSGGPYPPTTAGLGGSPDKIPDIPVCAVFLSLYIGFAVTNMAIFQINRRRQHKFVLSAMLFGFCMSRIATTILRIAWATRQHNIRLAMAAQIFVNAGVLLLYIINLILAQRILRATQPRVGWHPILRMGCRVLYVLIAAALAIVITGVILSFYTLNTHIRTICRDLQLAAITYLFVISCLPSLHIAAAVLLPRSKEAETFGEGSIASKLAVLAPTTCLAMFIAGFKCGTTWSPPRPIIHPAWYDSKACFYIFNFTFEILILCLFTFSRFDRRFFIPNGSKQPGDYTRRGQVEARQRQDSFAFADRDKYVSP